MELLLKDELKDKNCIKIVLVCMSFKWVEVLGYLNGYRIPLTQVIKIGSRRWLPANMSRNFFNILEGFQKVEESPNGPEGQYVEEIDMPI